ncbi:serine/threonine protein kinase [Psychrobacter frigidicola]|uniref:Serine/threonine protein kinase n=1 Tax=Psychrobacter frigidicola TaxID=45611 RepID=A0A5C7ABN9_9GAMM|nr:serine/threonine-protein kinase [Psychrobacter frigidicola]TXD98263.1 serine/threonine protein kinase [Psychrobacter frigidicola]
MKDTSHDLQAQALTILPVLTEALLTVHYHKISHQRMSQSSQVESYSYQGLTCAQHPKFGSVMIKWSLVSGTDDANSSIFNQGTSDLGHEITVLQTLDESLSTQAQHNTANLISITPPILAYDTLKISVLNQHHLTILVMPYYPNGSLTRWLKDKESPLLSVYQKQQFIIEVAHLITNLHREGWLHNDIKPSNILLDNFLSNSVDNGSTAPRLLLTDFALAQRLDDNSNVRSAGTPAYRAPELWQGRSATQQSDIYAFGVMMYEILTGKRPFKIIPQSNEPLKDWAIEHCQRSISALPKEYCCYQNIINKTLAKRAEQRYKNMEEVLLDLKVLLIILIKRLN